MTALAIALPGFTVCLFPGQPLQGHLEPWGTGMLTLVSILFQKKVSPGEQGASSLCQRGNKTSFLLTPEIVAGISFHSNPWGGRQASPSSIHSVCAGGTH